MYQVWSDLYQAVEAPTHRLWRHILHREVFVKINGKQHYLWRAVDQDGEVIDVFLQSRRDGAAAKRFFKRLLREQGEEPREIVTDKLRSYVVALRELIPETIHNTARYANTGRNYHISRPGLENAGIDKLTKKSRIS